MDDKRRQRTKEDSATQPMDAGWLSFAKSYFFSGVVPYHLDVWDPLEKIYGIILEFFPNGGTPPPFGDPLFEKLRFILCWEKFPNNPVNFFRVGPLGQIDLYGWTGKIGDDVIKVGALIYKNAWLEQSNLSWTSNVDTLSLPVEGQRVHRPRACVRRRVGERGGSGGL